MKALVNWKMGGRGVGGWRWLLLTLAGVLIAFGCDDESEDSDTDEDTELRRAIHSGCIEHFVGNAFHVLPHEKNGERSHQARNDDPLKAV